MTRVSWSTPSDRTTGTAQRGRARLPSASGTWTSAAAHRPVTRSPADDRARRPPRPAQAPPLAPAAVAARAAGPGGGRVAVHVLRQRPAADPGRRRGRAQRPALAPG